MRFIRTLSAASAFCSSVTPSPNEICADQESFTVHQTTPKPFILSGPAQIAKTYARYGKTAPADVKAAVAGKDGTVIATPTEDDVEYLTPVVIGGQTLNMLFDTGSADLVVLSTELPESNQTGHRVYNASKSTTSKILSGYDWNVTYGDGSSAKGDVYTDQVTVGAITVATQSVELAESVSDAFQEDFDCDGILGLGFDSGNNVSPKAQKTIFTNLKTSLSVPVFTVDLKRGAPGSYDFGMINSTKHTGAITYVPVRTGKRLWEFTMNGYAIGSDTFQTRSINTIADTGANFVYLPAVIVSAYYAKVPGALYNSAEGAYTSKCSATLPNLTLGIGSYNATVPGSYLKFTPIDRRGINCFGALQPNIDASFSVLGDVFFQSQFVVFNATSHPRIGFAPKPIGTTDKLVHPPVTPNALAFFTSCRSESRRLMSSAIQYVMSLRQ